MEGMLDRGREADLLASMRDAGAGAQRIYRLRCCGSGGGETWNRGEGALDRERKGDISEIRREREKERHGK